MSNNNLFHKYFIYKKICKNLYFFQNNNIYMDEKKLELKYIDYIILNKLQTLQARQ